MLAAACLHSALVRSSEGRHWRLLPTPAAQETADNAALLSSIVARRPDTIGATLYLWNVERTLRLLAALKRRLPRLQTVVGGPEVARAHPLLFPAPVGSPPPPDDPCPVDVLVIGEGEAVFPGILAALRRGRGATDWRNVAWCRAAQGAPPAHARFVFGNRPPPVRPLAALVPPATHPILRPDAQGMAYLETNRGCPMRCAFCCYNLRRTGWSSLPPREVERRIRILRRRGAREIRLVDPTFNAHPRFRELLAAMRRANADRALRFFVELRADTLRDDDIAAMARANIAEAEVGVQSLDPVVLRGIHRPTDAARTLDGIRRLQRAGIRPTIDFLYGLPRQKPDDIRQALAVLSRFPRAHPQFLPVLLLPGTELRDRAQELGLRAQPLPPYRVQSTRHLRADQLAAIERLAQEKLGGFDTPTRRFVGRRLPDLFAARTHVRLPLRPSPEQFAAAAFAPGAAAGAVNRRCVVWRGADLFAWRVPLIGSLRQAVLREPDILWQFVLAPQREEPLDLLDTLSAALHALPSHWLDRLVSPAGEAKLAARRLFVKLPAGRAFDTEWCAAAEELLARQFH